MEPVGEIILRQERYRADAMLLAVLQRPLSNVSRRRATPARVANRLRVISDTLE
jgi:hypothetical protein